MFSTLGHMVASGPRAFNIGNRFPECVVIDFTDTYYYQSTGKYGSVYVRDLTNANNNYKGVPEDFITFSRASNASFVNSSGYISYANSNILRYDHNPYTKTLNGLLIEQSSNNLFTRSQEFSNSVWTFSNTSVSNASFAAPDGTMTASLLNENSNTSSHVFYRSVTVAANTGHTFSLFVKSTGGEKRYLRMQMSMNTSSADTVRCVFDVENGTIANATSTNTGSSSFLGAAIDRYANSWYRLSVSGICNGGNTSMTCLAYMQTSNGISATYEGNNSTNIAIWGAQVESCNVATSYIPTTSAAVNRSLDGASVLTTKFPGNPSTKGTLIAKAIITDKNAQQFIATLDDATTAERIAIYTSSFTTPSIIINDGGVQQTALTIGSSITDTRPVRVAVSYQVNDIAACCNGGTVSTDATGTIPTITQLRIGDRSTGGIPMQGHMQQLIWVPTALTDDQVKAFSTIL